MEQKFSTCAHVLDDRAALLKESLRKEPWELKRTCARCGEVLYPTKGTLALMGVVDKLYYLLAFTLGICTKHILPSDLPRLANFLICLVVFLLSCWILRVVTRPILLAARWQPMDDCVGGIPREDILRQWYSKTIFLTLICFTVIAAAILGAVF